MKYFLLILFSLVTNIYASDLDKRVQKSYDQMVSLNEKTLADFPSGGQTIAVLNVNLGLLTGRLAYVPEYETRKKHFIATLRAFLREKKVDFVFLQELWYEDDFKSVLKLAKEEGFLPALSANDYSAKVSKIGMQILVRESALAKGSKISEVNLSNYAKTTRLEYWGRYKRALMSALVTLKVGRKVRLANTHLSATVGANDIRSAQVSEMTAQLKKLTAAKEVLLFGSDFNVSPEFEDALAGEVKQWEENRAPYVNFFEATHVVEAFKTLHPKDPGYTWDKRTNTLISDGPSVIKDEPLQRTDCIWVGIPEAKFEQAQLVAVVEEASLVFTKPTIPVGTKKVHLTDHFGNFAKIRVR